MPRYPVEPAWEIAVTRLYDASVGLHAITDRWTYTVPAGRFAILSQVHLTVQSTPGIDEAQVQIELRNSAGALIHVVSRLHSTTTAQETRSFTPQIVMNEGEVLVGRTVNTLVVARFFVASAHVIEILK